MFAQKNPIPRLTLIRGNTVTIKPELTYKEEPLTSLSEGYSLLFIVKGATGETYLSKTLSGTEEGTPIIFEIKPEDTIDLAPYHYLYSFDLFTGTEEPDFYTLQRGVFELTHEVGNINDIRKENV